MLDFSWFHHLSLFVIWIGVAALLSACLIFGYQLGIQAKYRKMGKSLGSPETATFVASSLLGLLTLILGFTFSMAISRFEIRRQLAINEANAIGTTYLRVKLLKGSSKDTLISLLKRYVDARIEYYDAPLNSEKMQSSYKKIKLLQHQIWSEAIRSTTVDRGAIESIFINSLNSMIDLETERTIALTKTLPEIIYWVILIISGVGLAAFEFSRGIKSDSGQGWPLLLALVISCVFMLIHDLERPRTGAIRITQDALVSLRTTLSTE